MSEHDLLLRYTEYLDGEGLLVGEDVPSYDFRTMAEMVTDFLAIDAQRTLW